MDLLANGTLLVTWMSAEDPTERTARAARFALLVRDVAPTSTIVVATGLSDTADMQPIGQALDRAASLLTRDEGSSAPGIRLDAVAAGLLDSAVPDRPGRRRLRAALARKRLARERGLAANVNCRASWTVWVSGFWQKTGLPNCKAARTTG